MELTEIESILSKYGEKDRNPPMISLPKFLEFLIAINGDTGTRQEIFESFQFLARGEAELTPANILFASPSLLSSLITYSYYKSIL